MQMTRTRITLALLAAFAVAGLAQAQPAQPKAAAPAAAAPAAAPAAASTGKALYPQSQFDFMLKERLAQGGQDTPELRNAIREELNTRELLMREAKKANLDKQPDVKQQMDLASQTVLVRAYVTDWIKKNPIPDAELKKEYDAIKAQMGDKEYKVKHILVEKEDEAKDVIAQLQKGAKFDELAKARSKDPGSKDRGGDLDWNAPGGFVKPFSDAMVATPKGKFTATPVQTQFGYHVILVEDIRDAKVPSFDEVKPQLTQRVQAAYLDKYFKELRAKNGV
ncbi:MAG TPA: peptidylprolyl isomerase [Casimicrobiaceae bacterium]|nr:peptidylprolyl isomerase [Casimicrobiaceae bacterium]